MRHTVHRNIFACTFTPRTITGAWLSWKSPEAPFSLRAYYTYRCNNLELEYLYIFNPTRITSLISSWYCATKQEMPLVYSLAGPALHEKIVSFSHATPTYNQLPIPHTPHMQWEYTYLYSYDTAHYFYLCGFQKALLFQYQLIGINKNLPLQTITSQAIALLSAYRCMFGNAFRAAHLALALSRCNNNIEQLFSRDDLARLLHIPSFISITPQDIIPLLVSCGLFAGEGENT